LSVKEVHFKPETESRLKDLASKSGRPTHALVEDALAGYWEEAAQVREMLDRRYDDIKGGRVKPIGGRPSLTAFASPRTNCLSSAIRNDGRPGFTLHPEAALDVTEIWEFIAKDDPLSARRVRRHSRRHP
jgi:predicted transcriptional regulator